MVGDEVADQVRQVVGGHAGIDDPPEPGTVSPSGTRTIPAGNGSALSSRPMMEVRRVSAFSAATSPRYLVLP